MQTVPVRVKIKPKHQLEEKKVFRVVYKIGLHIICLVLLSTILFLVHSYQIDRAESNAYTNGYKTGCDKGFSVGYDLGNDNSYDLGFDLGYEVGIKDALDRNTTGQKSIDAIRAKHGIGDTASDFLVKKAYGEGDNSRDQNQARTQLLDTANKPFDLSFWEWISQKISKAER